MTDTLAEMALTFCRECLGWPDARLQPGDVNHVCNMTPGDWNSLVYSDIEPVMTAVSFWCKQEGYNWCIVGRTDGIYAANILASHGGSKDGVGRSGECRSLCEALMSACLSAVGKSPTAKQVDLFAANDIEVGESR